MPERLEFAESVAKLISFTALRPSRILGNKKLLIPNSKHRKHGEAVSSRSEEVSPGARSVSGSLVLIISDGASVATKPTAVDTRDAVAATTLADQFCEVSAEVDCR